MSFDSRSIRRRGSMAMVHTVVVLLVLAIGSFIALMARWAAPDDEFRRQSTMACVISFVVLSIGLLGYVAFEFVVGCHRGDSEYVNGDWRLIPLGNHCDFPATDELPAATTEPGWGVSAAAVMVVLLAAAWTADTAAMIKERDEKHDAKFR